MVSYSLRVTLRSPLATVFKAPSRIPCKWRWVIFLKIWRLLTITLVDVNPLNEPVGIVISPVTASTAARRVVNGGYGGSLIVWF